MTSRHSPLEVFKYCPKCGKHTLEHHTEKSLKCSNCGFVYFINMSASVAAIIKNDKNEILFTVRKHEPAAGMLDLPGGFVDLGETAELAIIREVFEELNLEIKKLDFIATFTNKYIFSKIEYQTLDLLFNCSVESFEKLQVADDVSGYEFKNLASIELKDIGLESIKDIIRYLTAAQSS